MSLEQDEINRLVEIEKKKNLALDAIEKVRIIYMDATDMVLENELVNLTEIGETIALIESFISPNSQYIQDFKRLQSSYERKLIMKGI